MKIIGKQKDYFDYLIHQYGVDEKLVLDRRGIGQWKSERNNNAVGGYNGMIVDRKSLSSELPPRTGRFRDTEYSRDEELLTWLIVNGRGFPLVPTSTYPHRYALADDTNSKVGQGWWKVPPFVGGTQLQEFIDLSKIVKRHVFIAALSYRHDDWEIAGDVPVLNDLRFGSIVVPMIMYLETVNFISEHFVDKGEEIVVQSSLEKLVSHGFDKKISFRGKA